MNKIHRKLFQTKATSIDEVNKSVTFVISTNQEDRYGEVVDQKSWDFKSYLKNPLVLWGHDSDSPEDVLGTANSLKVADDGSQTTATLTFDTDINPQANMVFNQIKRGTLRTVSVGFINHSFEVEEDVPILKDNELLEISVVPIPANAGAVALSLKAGEINRKDAKWLMDSMRKEADLMEALYDASSEPTNKEKSMTPEQATALIEGMAKLTERLEDQAKTIETLATTVEELKPAEETEEAKTAREAKEAEDQAEADKQAADEEAARKADEDEKAKEALAKSGDDDQDGAKETDDEIDEDAELTPEQQDQVEAALEELVNAQ